jgi:hypothetical protein
MKSSLREPSVQAVDKRFQLRPGVMLGSSIVWHRHPGELDLHTMLTETPDSFRYLHSCIAGALHGCRTLKVVESRGVSS